MVPADALLHALETPQYLAPGLAADHTQQFESVAQLLHAHAQAMQAFGRRGLVESRARAQHRAQLGTHQPRRHRAERDAVGRRPGRDRAQTLDEAAAAFGVERRDQALLLDRALTANRVGERRKRANEVGFETRCAILEQLREHVEIAHRSDSAAEPSQFVRGPLRFVVRHNLAKHPQGGAQAPRCHAQPMDRFDFAGHGLVMLHGHRT
jgi:hypothetical protein